MSSQQKKEDRKKARQLEQEQQAEKGKNKSTIKKILIAAIGAAGVITFLKYRMYIGYYLAAIAIPYGAYGLFVPYKSAREYAKKGMATTYSRYFGTLMLSVGVLGILYSQILPQLEQNKLFLVALLVYVVMFFFVMQLLQKRYLNPPEAAPGETVPTLDEIVEVARAEKEEAKKQKAENKKR